MAAGATYVPIATQTLGSSASSVTFSSIPQTYTDLVLIVNGSMATGATMGLQVGNGSIDTGNNYSRTLLSTDSGGSSSRTSNGGSLDTYQPASPFTNTFNFMNYSNTTTYKTILYTTRTASGSQWLGQFVGLWRGTSAINILSLSYGSSTYATGTTFTLYGIAAA